MTTSNLSFPKGFLWGTATAGHQVEGNNVNSDWWEWERKNNVEKSGITCDHYRLYKKDFKLAKEVLNNNSHRFSIEWARVEPKMGEFSDKEINHYKEVLKELRRLKMKTFVTMHHFVNPLWFSELGGWEKRENLKYFRKFVEQIVSELGDLIDYWVVINEPNSYVATSYFSGQRPPQKKSFLAGAKVFINLARAHKDAYRIVHQKYPRALVSSANSMSAFKSYGLLDSVLIWLGKLFFNNLFLLLTNGFNDYIGINYYGLHNIKLSDLLYKKSVKKDMEKMMQGYSNDLAWLMYPEGIYEVIVDTCKKFKLPIVILENGIPDAKDVTRPRHILDHLAWLRQAIKEGFQVLGYHHWSLMDNFEWDLGKKVRFGLFEVDYKTLRRIPRKSCFVYGEVCKTNALPENSQI